MKNSTWLVRKLIGVLIVIIMAVAGGWATYVQGEIQSAHVRDADERSERTEADASFRERLARIEEHSIRTDDNVGWIRGYLEKGQH